MRILKYKINDEIKTPKVMLIGHDGEKLGLISLSDAKFKARQEGLDLAEVSNSNGVSICKIIDFKKLEYEAKKKKKKNKGSVVIVKEIRMKLVIEKGDYDRKINDIKKFLSENKSCKVTCTILLRGRELDQKERIAEFMDKIKNDMSDVAQCTSIPKTQGRRIPMTFAALNVKK